MLALLNLKSKVNIIYPTFAKELDYWVKLNNIGTQKINSNTLDFYEMVVIAFSMTNKVNQIRFFKKRLFW